MANHLQPTPAQLEILAMLQTVPMTAPEIAAARGVTVPTTHHAIARLIRDGYVIRRGNHKWRGHFVQLFHWTGKAFRTPASMALADLQVAALRLAGPDAHIRRGAMPC